MSRTRVPISERALFFLSPFSLAPNIHPFYRPSTTTSCRLSEIVLYSLTLDPIGAEGVGYGEGKISADERK